MHVFFEEDGTFKAGTDAVFDVKNDGAGYGQVNATGEKYVPEVDKQVDAIANGELTDIPREVSGN